MSEFVIPKRAESIDPYLDDEDMNLIDSLPEMLVEPTKEHFRNYNKNNIIRTMKELDAQYKQHYVQDIDATFRTIMGDVRWACLEENKKMKCKITGKVLLPD